MPVLHLRIVPEEGSSDLALLRNRSYRGDVTSSLIERLFKETEVYDICETYKLHWRVSPLRDDCVEVVCDNEMALMKIRLLA